MKLKITLDGAQVRQAVFEFLRTRGVPVGLADAVRLQRENHGILVDANNADIGAIVETETDRFAESEEG